MAADPTQPFLYIDTRQFRKGFGGVFTGRGSFGVEFPVTRFNPLQQGRIELIRIERFGDVVVHAGFDTLFTISGHGMSGHGDDRRRSGLLLFRSMPVSLELSDQGR